MSNALKISGLHPLQALVSHVAALVSIASQGSEAPGIVKDFAGPEANVPSGYLLCDGRALSRTTYAALYAAIGTTHGSGDGSTTFNIPDARGYTSAAPDNMGGTPAGRLSGATLGAKLGVQSVTLTSAQSGLPAHSHSASSSTDGNHTHSQDATTMLQDSEGGGTIRGTNPASLGGTTGAAGAHSHTITVNSNSAQGASQAHTNVQPTIIFNKIIKT